MRSRLGSIVVIAVAAALVGLLAYGLRAGGSDDSIDAALASGQRPQAPVAELPRLFAGGRASLADYGGKVVLVNFWASWCKPCREEAPLLERVQRRISGDGALVLGVALKDNAPDAQAFFKRRGITYPSLRDGDGAYGRRFGTTALPESFLIDRDGHIAAARRGPVTERFIDEQVMPLVRSGAR